MASYLNGIGGSNKTNTKPNARFVEEVDGLSNVPGSSSRFMITKERVLDPSLVAIVLLSDVAKDEEIIINYGDASLIEPTNNDDIAAFDNVYAATQEFLGTFNFGLYYS